MKHFARFLTAVLLLGLCLAPCALAFDVVEPSSSFYAADYADVLLPETEEYIVNCNNSLSAQTGAQMVVVTVDFLDGADIEDYSTKLFNQWKIGDAEKQNGLLILLAVGELDYWATQGTGIAAAPGLTSSLLDEYLNTYLEPDFSAAKYDDGVRKLFDALLDWYERYYSVTITPQPTALIAPEGFETLPESSGDVLTELPTEDNFEQHRQIIGRVAGTFLIILVIAVVAVALVILVPRYISLRKQGYRYSIFNRAFWSKRHRPPPPSAVRHTVSPRQTVTPSDPASPRSGLGAGASDTRSSRSGGFGSGNSLRGRTSSGTSSRSGTERRK